jgi:L-threonylcarbamoyladenylate synthase
LRTEVRKASDPEAFEHAVQLLLSHKVVAFPTDTVYGVGAHGFDEAAILELYEVKTRERGKAIPYLIADLEQLSTVAREMSEDARALAAKFWPGGLTLVVPASDHVPKILIAGGESIAVRVPDNLTARSLIGAAGVPLAVTSANISGGKDPANAEDVFSQLDGRISLILDGGSTRGNTPSTVVDVTTDPPTVRRVGVISKEEVEQALGRRIGQVF